MTSIGVRELRQQASYCLRLVAAGAHVEVTDRGRPVAMLVPVKSYSWAALIASGQAVEATGEGAVLDEPPADYGGDAGASNRSCSAGSARSRSSPAPNRLLRRVDAIHLAAELVGAKIYGPS